MVFFVVVIFIERCLVRKVVNIESAPTPSASFDAAKQWIQLADDFTSVAQLCERFEPTHVLFPDSLVSLGGHAWQIHCAPGHDPNSVILFEPTERILISADAL